MKNKLISNISNSLPSKPYLIQVAKDMKWEETWNIDLTKDVPTKEQIINYLKEKSFESIAIESLFTNSDGETTIFGMIHNKNLKVASEADFINIICEESKKYTGFESFTANIEEKIVGKNNILYVGDPSMVRVGIVNHWFSVGIILIWEKGRPRKISGMELQEILANKPEVNSTNLNYQGVSFIYKDNEFNLYHWIKPQCGIKKGGIFVVDKNKILNLFNNWFNFETQ